MPTEVKTGLVLVNPPAPMLGEVNAILVARARQHRVTNFVGPLSIKTVVDGAVTWTTGGRDMEVDEHSLLVLNDGERYSLDIDELKPVETCCAFFRKGFVESVFHNVREPEELDPVDGLTPLVFLSRLHPREERILPRMRNISRAARNHAPPLWIGQEFVELGRDLLALYQETNRAIRRIPATRQATRLEIYRRLERGREYMHSALGQPLTLEEIARAGCLSQYHFHRMFTLAFRETPHQYLTRLRMTRARRLVAESSAPVVNICDQLGFSSLASFTALFRRKFGAPPAAFRRRRHRESPAN